MAKKVDRKPGSGGARPGAGRKPTGRKKRSITLTDDEYARLTDIALRKGTTRSDVISGWIEADRPDD